MTAATPHVPTAVPRARFRDLVAAEWIKLWSLRSTSWTLALVTLSWPGSRSQPRRLRQLARLRPRASGSCSSAPRRLPLAATLILVLAAGSLGAVAIVGEYGSGLIRTTFAAVPARRRRRRGQVGVVAAVMTAAGRRRAAAFAVSQAILSGRDAALSITDPVALRASRLGAARPRLRARRHGARRAGPAHRDHRCRPCGDAAARAVPVQRRPHTGRRPSTTRCRRPPTSDLVADPTVRPAGFRRHIPASWLEFAGSAVASVAVTVVMMRGATMRAVGAQPVRLEAAAAALDDTQASLGPARRRQATRPAAAGGASGRSMTRRAVASDLRRPAVGGRGSAWRPVTRLAPTPFLTPNGGCSVRSRCRASTAYRPMWS